MVLNLKTLQHQNMTIKNKIEILNIVL